jgi:apolipoprotein N-acyltransferase
LEPTIAQPSTRLLWLLAAASGVAYFAAFPPLDWSALGFVALAPLVAAVRDQPRGRAFLLGWLAGTIACSALVSSSVATAAIRYFGAPTWAAALAGALAAQLYGAPYFGAFAWLAREIQARLGGSVARAFAIAAAWVVSELGRSRLGHGAPWVLLAHSQHARLWILQVAELGGAAAVSFFVALVGAALGLTLAARLPGATPRSTGRDARAVFATAALSLGAVFVYGRVRLTAVAAERGRPLRVGIVQGALPDEWRYSLRGLSEALGQMRALTARVAAEAPDLVIWPENALSVAVSPDQTDLRPVMHLLPPGAQLLVGAPRAVQVAPGRAELRNTAWLLDADGRVASTYDKYYLTPWAETAPWPLPWLPGAAERARGAYAPGGGPRLLDFRGHPVAAPICSEAIYSGYVRELVQGGAELLVNLANDAWFGDQPAVEQHMDAALLRAVETRRYLLRSTTTGITAVVAPTGEVVQRAPIDEPAILLADVQLLTGRTVYTRVGDAFAWACTAAIAALLLFSRATPPLAPPLHREEHGRAP